MKKCYETKKETIPRLCAIVGELIDVEEFKDALGPRGEIFLDERNDVKRALTNEGKIRTSNLDFMISANFWNKYHKAQKEYPKIKGQLNSQDGLKLGGILVVNSKGILIYKFIERNIGDKANIKKMKKKICKMT